MEMSSVADQDILLEQQADERRVVEEAWLAEYLAIAKQQRADAQRAREEEEQAELERARAATSTQLVDLLAASLGITIPRERVWFVSEDLWWGGQRPVVSFGGRTFGYQVFSGEYRVAVFVPCSKCYKPMWRRADSWERLLEALESSFSHAVCPSREDGAEDDYEIVEPKPSPAERYTAAIKHRRDLQFERGREKEFAVRRIIANKGVTFGGESFVAGSATAAEKLVEFDENYAAVCRALTDAVVEEIGAREALRAAGGDPKREDEEA